MSITKYICDSLLITESELSSFSKVAPYSYKRYFIEKRNGKGRRLIAQPSRELKFIQRLISSYLEKKLPIHDSAFAYRKQRGIKDNAKIHVDTKYLLKMDFHNFFPSITPELFFSVSERSGIGFNSSDKELLKKICFIKERRVHPYGLSIGSPISPLISNSVMYFFDEQLTAACDEIGILYSRYADDLTFSTNKKDILIGFDRTVKSIINSEMGKILRINDSKTVYSSKAHNRHVTGVTLSNHGALSIGRKKKRMLSSLIHKSTVNALDEEEQLQLAGYLAFAYSIEPEFIDRMRRKYGDKTIKAIIKRN